MKFLNPGQLIDFAAKSLNSCRIAETAKGGLKVQVEALKADIASATDNLEAARVELVALSEIKAAEQQQAAKREAQLVSRIEDAKADLFRVTGELEESKAAYLQLLSDPASSPAATAVRSTGYQSSPHFVFELGTQTRILAWSVVGGCFF